MGNVCASGHDSVDAPGQQYQAKPYGQHRSSMRSVQAVAPSYQDDIEQALAEARAEVDSCMQRRLANDFDLGKIVGHGAFAKVHICTERKTGKLYAAKSLQKNSEDLKQRESKHMCGRVLHRILSGMQPAAVIAVSTVEGWHGVGGVAATSGEFRQ